MIYKTSLDNLAKIITAGITVLFAVIIIGQYSFIKDTGKMVPHLTTIALLLIYGISYAFRPADYVLTKSTLTIHRPIKDIIINRKEIDSIELLNKDQLACTIRTFGVGGLFGYYGKFANTKLGRMTWYATRRDKMILVSTKENKKIVLTPDETEKFLLDLGE
jgi:hypothetical protein